MILSELLQQRELLQQVVVRLQLLLERWIDAFLGRLLLRPNAGGLSGPV
jgi:hypothetical protein